MTWTQIAWMVTTSLGVLWWMWRSRGQHRGGYLLALDHVEPMTKGRLDGPSLPDVLTKLRGSAAGVLP